MRQNNYDKEGTLMAIIYTITIATVVIVAVIKERNIYNPLTVFAGMWLITGFFSFMNLYSLYEVPDSIYLIVLMGVLLFATGCAVRTKVRIHARKISGLTSGSYNELNYRFLLPFYTFVLLFTVVLASRAIPLVVAGLDMDVIRFNYRNLESGIIIRTIPEKTIENYIIATAEFAGVALVPIVMMDKPSYKRNILLTELMAFFFLHIFVTGARSFLFDVAFVLVLYVLINTDLSKRISEAFRKLPKFAIGIVIFLCVFVVIRVTVLRRGEVGVLTREIYGYFTMSFRLLDVHMDLMRANPDYTYGMTLLNGLLRLPLLLIRSFLGIPYPALFQKAYDAIAANNNFYYIGSGRANSFVTVFYYFFMDFGYFGIVIGSFLYGYLSQASYYSMKKHTDKRSMSIYLLIALGLFLSFVRFHFTASRYIYAFFVLLLCFRNSSHQS